MIRWRSSNYGKAGWSFFGGPLLVVPFLVYYTRKRKLPIWLTLDLMAIGSALAHTFGRLGCFGAGCCHGKPTESLFGVKFYSPLVDQALRGIPLHPTQLYEAVSVFILFLGLLWVLRNRKFEGQVALTYLIAYPVIRSIIEEFRGDSDRGTVLGGTLSTSQGISILVFAGALVAWWYRNQTSGQKSRRPEKQKNKK
jgi:phosphatidylglycerol:prolipoprotein diacylglycerol transferase